MKSQNLQTRVYYRKKSVSVIDSPLLSRGSMGYQERLKQILCEKSIKRGDFVLASGQRSNYYIDAKLTTLAPEGLFCTTMVLWEKLKSLKMFPKAIGGLATGADPIVAEVTALSFRESGPLVYGFYVRPETKSHGTKKRVEGYEGSPGDPVVIVDDVCTKGNSAITAIQEAHEKGWEVIAAICLVDREEGAMENIEKHCPFHAIFTASELLAEKEKDASPDRLTAFS